MVCIWKWCLINLMGLVIMVRSMIDGAFLVAKLRTFYKGFVNVNYSLIDQSWDEIM